MIDPHPAPLHDNGTLPQDNSPSTRQPSTSPTVSARSLLRAWVAYAADDFQGALVESTDPFVDVTVTYRIYTLAARSALALGDVDRARAALAALPADMRAFVAAGLDRHPLALI